MKQTLRGHFLCAAASMVAAAELGAIGVARAQPSMMHPPIRLPDEGGLPSLEGASTWLNSQPLTASALQGKVALIDFWTYTCVNWRRTLPYIRAWADKYKALGFVVIGVHTPEFSFEKNLDNIRQAAKDMRISYPVAVDSDYSIWKAFNNEYWPAEYLVDAHGRIRHHRFGEGDYAQSERAIQQLLSENGAVGTGSELVSIDPDGFEAAADWNDVKSPETYVGFGRTERFASPGGLIPAQRRAYTAPVVLSLNDWALSGDWTVGREAAALNGSTGRCMYRFHARDLNLIMGPGARGSSVRFRIQVDGKLPGAAHGLDADAQGAGTLADQRMYQLIRQPKPIVDRQFEIEFLDSGVQVFDFTFG